MKRVILCLAAAMLLFTAAVAEDTKDAGVFDLLLIGVDTLDAQQGARSDAMMLVRLDPARGSVRVISFLRDLYVQIPGHGRNRLNASYAFGGAALLRRTLEENFGVTADAHAVVDFSRLAAVIDDVGGVEAEVDDAERVQLNGILRHYNRAINAAEDDGLLDRAGVRTLTGKQALCYSRIRRIDDDFRRTSRQREVLEAAFRKVTALDTLSLAKLALRHLRAVETDLTAVDVIRLIPLALRMKDASFRAMTVPVSGAYEDRVIAGMQVLVPDGRRTRQAIDDFLTGE